MSFVKDQYHIGEVNLADHPHLNPETFKGILGYDPRLGNGDPRDQCPPLAGLPLKKASIFQPPLPGYSPYQLFTHHASEHDIDGRCHPRAHRFVRRNVPFEMLIYTDGSCLDQNDAMNTSIRRAGCSFVFKPEPYTMQERSVAFRLEAKGPTGQESVQTSNRAELRAVIAALECRRWEGERWKRMVIATDSEYVVLGITQRIEEWVDRRWRNSAGKAIKNRDLWQYLLDRINLMGERGVEVVFWRIPRELNTQADGLAREAARSQDAPADFSVHHITLM